MRKLDEKAIQHAILKSGDQTHLFVRYVDPHGKTLMEPIQHNPQEWESRLELVFIRKETKPTLILNGTP